MFFHLTVLYLLTTQIFWHIIICGIKLLYKGKKYYISIVLKIEKLCEPILFHTDKSLKYLKYIETEILINEWSYEALLYKITANGSAINLSAKSSVIVKNCVVDAEYEAIFASSNGGATKAIIENCKFSCTGNTIVSHSEEIIVESGEYSSTQSNLFKVYVEGSSITINGGTFTAAGVTYTFDQLNVDIVRSLVAESSGTFNVEKVGNSFVISK